MNLPEPMPGSEESSLLFGRINALLPSCFAFEWLSIGNLDARLYPEEEFAVRQAVPSRKLEFSAGRECARRALRKLGRAPMPIGVGTGRQPVWPEGFVGSITHQDSFAMAAVADSRKIRLIGIDLATSEPLEKSLVRLVCSDEEVRDAGPATAYPGGVCPYKLVFSIKEALFKCLFPVVGQYFDFLDVYVKPNPADLTADVVLLNRLVFAGLEKPTLNFRCCVVGNYLFSAAWGECDK